MRFSFSWLWLLLVLAVPVMIGINALIIWLVWRAVKKPVPVTTAAAPAPTTAKSGWGWLVVLGGGLLLGLLVLGALAFLWLFARQGRPQHVIGPQVPLVLNLEIQRGATVQNAPVTLVAGQRAFSDIVRLPRGSFTVNGTVWPDNGGSYTLQLEVRRHPDDSSSLSASRVVYDNVPFWLGALGDDEFRVRLSRARDTLGTPRPAASWWSLGGWRAVSVGLALGGIMAVLLWRTTRQWVWVLPLIGLSAALLAWAFWPKAYRESQPIWLGGCKPTQVTALELDKGAVFSMRTQGSFTDKNVWDWMRGNGGDLTVLRWQGQWWLRMRDGRLWEVVDEQWRRPDPNQVQEILRAGASQDKPTKMEGHNAYALGAALPVTYVFQTAEGGYGLLQVRGQETTNNDTDGRLLVVVRTFK